MCFWGPEQTKKRSHHMYFVDCTCSRNLSRGFTCSSAAVRHQTGPWPVGREAAGRTKALLGQLTQIIIIFYFFFLLSLLIEHHISRASTRDKLGQPTRPRRRKQAVIFAERAISTVEIFFFSPHTSRLVPPGAAEVPTYLVEAQGKMRSMAAM